MSFDTLNHLLNDTMRLHHHLVWEKFDALGVYRGQPRLLKILLHKDGTSKKELYEEMDLAPPTLSKMVDRLQNSGFVYTEKDKEDQRVSRVYLTTKGRAAMNEVTKAMIDINKVAFKGFSDNELSVLEVLLKKMKNNLLVQREEKSQGLME